MDDEEAIATASLLAVAAADGEGAAPSPQRDEDEDEDAMNVDDDESSRDSRDDDDDDEEEEGESVDGSGGDRDRDEGEDEEGEDEDGSFSEESSEEESGYRAPIIDGRKVTFTVRDLNDNLVCTLCDCYFRHATMVTECLPRQVCVCASYMYLSVAVALRRLEQGLVCAAPPLLEHERRCRVFSLYIVLYD